MYDDNERRSKCPSPKISSFIDGKGILDRGIAAFLLVFALPVIGFFVLLVRLSSKGPGLYSQKRVGKDGEIFTLYKIRSMRVDAESTTGAVWATRKDPRITRLGAFLRYSHLDELPQLLNVLWGDMALVGPRPERPEFVEKLSNKIDGYSHRLIVKPGVTGYAQLNLPSDNDLNDVRRKLVLDFEYIEKASPWFDFRLLLGTVMRFTRFIGPWPLKLLGIYRQAEESSWASALQVSAETIQFSKEQQLEHVFRYETTP